MFLVVNSDFKFKLLNEETKMCRKTVLGPTYCSELDRMHVLPAYPSPSSDRLLVRRSFPFPLLGFLPHHCSHHCPPPFSSCARSAPPRAVWPRQLLTFFLPPPRPLP